MTSHTEIPHTEVEVFSLGEANRVLELIKHSGIRGAAVMEVP